MYIKMDYLVGETMAEVNLDNEILIVMSDHGFGPFKRCFNINTWLAENGYLFFKNDENTGADIIELLWALNESDGMTMVIVTHDDHIAPRAHRWVSLHEGLAHEKKNHAE